MNNCSGCSCIKNFNDNTKFCGKTVSSKNGKSSTIFGCKDTCQQCKKCHLNNNNNNNNNNGQLSKKEFLKFLKGQRAKNVREGILPPIVEETIPEPIEYENNNAQANHSDLPKTKDECFQEEGYMWNNENMTCDDLMVTFFTQKGEDGSSFQLSKGNYDETDILSFEFKPSFIAVPMGLRVKIWKKSGFVGQELGYLGNNKPKNNNKQNLYPVEEIGSIQICNMKNCVRPSEFGEMSLISLIDGYNIDFVEDNVNNLGEYKERLRQKIEKKLLDIRFTHKECLELVSKYLSNKDIDIDKDLSKTENSFTLQKILSILTEIPNCNNLISNESLGKSNESLGILNKNETELSFSPIETIIEKISPAPSHISLKANNETETFETDNLSFIIFIFIFLLIILLVSALIYFYFNTERI